MNCQEFQQQLEISVDQRQLVEATNLCEHAMCCDHCRTLWDEFLVLEAAIADWRSESWYVDLTGRVLADFQVTPRAASRIVPSMESPGLTVVRVPNAPSQRGLWPVIVTVALALSLVVAVLVSRHGPTGHSIARPDKLPLVVPTEDFADLSDIVQDAKSAWLGLAHTTAQRARDLRVFVPTLGSSTGDDLPSQPMDADRLDEMTDGLTPVPNEVKRAFEFLINAAQFEESQTT